MIKSKYLNTKVLNPVLNIICLVFGRKEGGEEIPGVKIFEKRPKIESLDLANTSIQGDNNNVFHSFIIFIIKDS